MQIEQRAQDDLLILDLSGRLDATTSAEAMDELLGLVDEGHHRLVINLEKLEYISSAGLRVFLMLAKKLKGVQGKVHLYGLPETVKEIFDISGFTSIFAIHNTSEEALAAIRSEG